MEIEARPFQPGNGEQTGGGGVCVGRAVLCVCEEGGRLKKKEVATAGCASKHAHARRLSLSLSHTHTRTHTWRAVDRSAGWCMPDRAGMVCV